MSPEVPIIILILAIPIYFFSKWIFKKLKVGDAKNRKYLALIPAIFLSPLLYVIVIIMWVFTISYYPKTTFNKQRWDENKEERYKMSKDIIKSELLIGKTKEEIINLLGDDFYIYSENHIAYDLGFVPELFNIDPDVLDIYFENEKVIEVNQH